MVLTGSVYSESPARRRKQIEQITQHQQQGKQPTRPAAVATAMRSSAGGGVGINNAGRFTVLPLRKIQVQESASSSSSVGASSSTPLPPVLVSEHHRRQPDNKLGGAVAPVVVGSFATRRNSSVKKQPTSSNNSATLPPVTRKKSISTSPTKTSGRSRSPVLTRDSIVKSASVPANLLKQTKQPGILKRSTSSLLEGGGRGLRSLLQRTTRRRSSADVTSSATSPTRVRKCVSFREDTTFVEAKKQTKKTAALHHESKVYRKGVLQDRNGSVSSCGSGADESPSSQTNLPLAWEESLGGPKALLGAAQDADDELVKRIVTLATKSGLGDIDLNAVDSSGRTAISYLAGNGSALMLEACLSFPGANPNLPDNEGNTPLHFAAQAGQTECLNILLQRCPSIEVDARNNLGFTPLMKAALQGRTKCAKILLFAGANPTLRDQGRGLKAEQWARFCGRYVCAEVIERFSRHKLLERTTSCRWGSEPELAAQVFQGKLMPIPSSPAASVQQSTSSPTSGLKSKIRRVFRTSSSHHASTTEHHHHKASFSLVTQLTSAALCASSPVLPKPSDVSPSVKSLLRPLSVPQLRITLVSPQEIIEKTTFVDKVEMVKPPRTKKKNK